MKLLHLAILLLAIAPNLEAEDPVPAKPIKEKPEFVAELKKANSFLDAGNLVEAEKAYKVLRAKPTNNTTWAMTSNNLGIALREQKKFKESIGIFNEILLRKLNNRDPGGHVMEHFRNYHYHACFEIMRNHFLNGDHKEAIQALKLTRTKHQFQTCCATCKATADRSYRESLSFLEAELQKK